ncbi:MAG: Druantia anti-phage system protein DruA [Candidatus Cybelea sp.]
MSATEDFWDALEFGDKSALQEMHLRARNLNQVSRIRTASLYKKHKGCFIDGAGLEPAAILPVLKFVEPRSDLAELFQVARWTWSIPYSAGYGRRLRFVVWDDHHHAVIGIIGLQSPPLDLPARDEMFDYQPGTKLDLVNRTMDAYTIGAVPPYSYLLGGKLVAGLVASNEVQQAYWREYAGRKTLMRGKRIEQPLVAVTTLSAFGRSSIYNRLRYGDRLLAEPIGFTKGSGTIHLEPLYMHVLDLLRTYDPELVLGGYGQGPKQKWQLFKRALDILKIPRYYFEHGVKREVYLFRLVAQLGQGMAGGDFGPGLGFEAGDYGQYWANRWALPRASRDKRWRSFLSEEYFLKSLPLQERPAPK